MVILNKTDLKEITKYLEESKKSEDSADYRDEDSWGFGPTMAANNAKKRNAEITTLINKIKQELNDGN